MDAEESRGGGVSGIKHTPGPAPHIRKIASLAPGAGTEKHSPGPWRVTGYLADRGLHLIAPPLEHSCLILAHVIDYGDPDSEQPTPEARANAALIAAAPDLLEALKGLLLEVEEGRAGLFAGFTIRARAAIARAEGKATK